VTDRFFGEVHGRHVKANPGKLGEQSIGIFPKKCRIAATLPETNSSPLKITP